MTNLEKYKDEIMNFDNDDLDFCDGFVKKRILLPFGHNECEQIGCERCAMLQMIWLQEEYKEPEVDWSKVPVDTPIYVQDCISDIWYPRYFAKFKDRQVYAWYDGKTSFTVGSDDAIPWAYAKLAKDNCNFKEEQE